MKDLVSVIIASWNRKHDTAAGISSILKSSFKDFEIIVVDNASTDGTAGFLKKEFSAKIGKKIKIIESKKNLMAGGGRNLGIKHAKGNFLFFLDHDNTIGKDCIKELVNFAKSNKAIGVVGPKMYYHARPDLIWFAGGRIDLLSSRTFYFGNNQIDNGQFSTPIEIDHFPNAFMFKREVIEKVGGFFEFYEMEYEESDLCFKAREAGFKVFLVPNAKVWHNTPLPEEMHSGKKQGSTYSAKRSFLKARNRIVFMKRHAPALNLLVFFLLFVPFFILYYSSLFLLHGNIDSAKANFSGTISGIFFRKG